MWDYGGNFVSLHPELRRYSFRHGKKLFTTRKDAYPPLEKYRDLLPNRWKKQ